jgi:hypothetical protein
LCLYGWDGTNWTQCGQDFNGEAGGDDDEVMKCIMKGLDPVTWRPIVNDEEAHETNPEAFIDDKDSGYLYIGKGLAYTVQMSNNVMLG